MADKPKPNICQFWIKDEPIQCSYWDDGNQICIFESAPDESGATHAPNCNGIGTATTCNHYDGIGTKARCILPDPSRHVANRTTGEKWSRYQISGYNNGDCDGEGTDTTCSGYSPYHMAFSKLKPFISEEVDEEGFTTRDEFGYRLPLNYEIYNKRAQLSRCYWWKAETRDFYIDNDPSSMTYGMIMTGITKCTNPDEATNTYKQYSFDETTGTTSPPCNGSNPNCPCYTSSVCWKYCIDEKMRQGDKVLAEQLLELRYYIKKDGWTTYEYERSFEDPYIFAGIKLWRYLIRQNKDKYLIDTNRTYISDFEVFDVGYEQSFLTAGTPDETYKVDYPTKVKELKSIRLAPIIRNKFDDIGFYVTYADEIKREYIFEVSKLLHKHILIVGDVFYYGSKACAVNLSDPELGFLPRELIYFNSMAEIEAKYIEAEDPEGYNRFYEGLECKLESLIKYWPEKIAESEISGDNSFYINVETFFGNNDIVVFDKGSGFWEYDKVSVRKILCNGVIGQTSFFVDNSGNTVDYLPSYEDSFAGFANRTGEIIFGFFPFASSDGSAVVDYIYNDGIRRRLDVNPAYPAEFNIYEMCYKLFKIKIFDKLFLDQTSFKIFGNAGWILVTIPDEKKLSNVIKPWEVEGKIILTVIDSLDVLHDIEMEIVDREENIDKLEVNQIIIKPKDISQFRQPCSAVLSISPMYNYEKRSFNEMPDGEYEEVREPIIAEDDVIDYRSNLELEDQGGQYKLTGFGTEALMMSAVFKGINGRPRGQTKTKMITWVRQPYCRDVEINYSWYAEYQKCTLLPETFCWGPHGLRCEIELQRRGMTPPCGDHNLSIMSGKGPMWYPYGECDSVARWNITGPLTEWDISIMDCFWEGTTHGYWDMRMLGPDQRDGRTCDSHAHWAACTCDWSFCNYDKKTANIFSGSGMYRGGLEGEALFKCTANYGDPPKFGNTIRDFLRSFRSFDNVDYYYVSGTQFLRNRKWLPMPEFYTTSDVTADTSDYPFLLYSSNDFYNDGGSFVHPMGLMSADSQIEGVDIKEKVSSFRYRFEEVFDTHYSIASLYYPYPKTPYFRMVAGVPRPIISWYTYKDYLGEGGGSDKSIQWAWQEIWKDLERSIPDIVSFVCNNPGNITCCVQTIFKECDINPPYHAEDKEVCEVINGKHLFLDIRHPDYEYDVSLTEHRIVCDEGDHIINLEVPDFSISDEGDIDKYFHLQLDSGPERLFDIEGNWDPDITNENYNLYSICTQAPWINSVTIFATGYDNISELEAENDDRIILTYDEAGEEVKEYYQRGLDIAVLPNKFDYLPTKTEVLQSENYEVKFYELPEEFNEKIEINEWYSLSNCFMAGYNCGDVDNNEYITIEFKIKRESEDDKYDSGIGAISKIICQFTFGAEKSEEEAPKGSWFGELYNIPAVKVYVDDELSYECNEMYLSNKDENIEEKSCTYDLGLSINDIFDVKKEEAEKRKNIMSRKAAGKTIADIDTSINVKIKFRISPKQEEIEKISGLNSYYTSATNKIKLKCIYLYNINFVEAEEDITTWERKYNVSYGEHGDFPPHGYESTGSLLYPSLTDASTVYQYDSIGGVVGMPNSGGACKTMNKCRGRILGECRPDKEPLPGNDLYEWEAEQKKIHDDVVDSGDISFQMRAVCLPGLEEYLDKAGSVFQPWSCAFVNTAVMKLSPTVPREPFNAKGHYFDWDMENMHSQLCGGLLWGRFWRDDVFDYVYRSAATGEAMWDSMDVFVAYYYGAGSFLINPMNYLAAEMSLADQLQENIRSLTTQLSLFGTQQCKLPPAASIM